MSSFAASAEAARPRRLLGLPPCAGTTPRRPARHPRRPGARPRDAVAAPARPPHAGACGRLAADPGRAPGHAAAGPDRGRTPADRGDHRPRGADAHRVDARPALHPALGEPRRLDRPACGDSAAGVHPRRRHDLRRPRQPRRGLPAARRAGRRARPRPGLPARSRAPLPGRRRRLLGRLRVGRRARRGARRGPRADRRRWRLGRRDAQRDRGDQGRRGRGAVRVPAAVYPATDFHEKSESRRAFAEGFYLTSEFMDLAETSYLLPDDRPARPGSSRCCTPRRSPTSWRRRCS